MLAIYIPMGPVKIRGQPGARFQQRKQLKEGVKGRKRRRSGMEFMYRLLCIGGFEDRQRATICMNKIAVIGRRRAFTYTAQFCPAN